MSAPTASVDAFVRIRAMMDVLPAGVLLVEPGPSPTTPRSVQCNAEFDRIVGGHPGPGADTTALGYGYYREDRMTLLPTSEWPGVIAMCTGVPVEEQELHLRRADGEWRVVLSSAAPVREDGVLRGAVVVCRDTTAQKNLERALLDARHEAECANQQLREADRRKDEFLAVLSHELRNPLAPIRNSVNLLVRDLQDEERVRRAASVIDRQVSQLSRLVDDLLDVNRISHGKVQLRPERVELRDLVQRTVEDHRSILAARNIQARLELPGNEVWVRVDAARIGQVIGNLLQNAAKFTGTHGQVLVRVEKSDETKFVSVAVKDSGLGIAPEKLAYIFEPFAQLAPAPHSAQHGLGLGLALVKGLVELHGGKVAVSSGGPGAGAEFTFTVPLDTEPTALRAASAVLSARPKVRRKVVIIEDNVDGAESLRDILELVGHHVRVAFNGREGIRAAVEHGADVVLCDIGLPDMTGFEVARVLSANLAFTGKLVALTGYATADDEKLAAEAGFDHHLPKPADLDELAAILNE